MVANSGHLAPTWRESYNPTQVLPATMTFPKIFIAAWLGQIVLPKLLESGHAPKSADDILERCAIEAGSQEKR